MGYFIKSLNTAKKRVFWLLENNIRNRNSDTVLMANFWWYELGGENVNNMSAINFLYNLSKGRLTAPETIRRCRQKLQEENPELRGESYKERKKEAEEVTKQINK